MHLLNKLAQKKVARIHHAVDTAAERLLQEARTIVANTPKIEGQRHSDLVAQAETLKHIGFVNSKNVVIADLLHEKYQRNVNKTNQAQGIEQLVLDYQYHFPFHKFLTVDQLLEICIKYNLVFHPVEQYIGEIPQKNIQEMINIPNLDKNEVYEYKEYTGTVTEMRYKNYTENLDFRVQPKYFVTVSSMQVRNNNGTERGLMQNKRIQVNREQYGELRSTYDSEIRQHLAYICKDLGANDACADDFFNAKIKLEVEDSSKFYIAAPTTEFDLNKKLLPSLSEIFHVQLDPIVFRMCRGGIQVITKWGLEASDPLLVNNIEN